eukprot:scaffold165074_cov22-Tisochrysis_lutea.AAC.1
MVLLGRRRRAPLFFALKPGGFSSSHKQVRRGGWNAWAYPLRYPLHPFGPAWMWMLRFLMSPPSSPARGSSGRRSQSMG